MAPPRCHRPEDALDSGVAPDTPSPMDFPPAPACPQPPQIPDDLHGDLDDREDLEGGIEENANKEVEGVVSQFGHVKVSQE